MKDYYRNATLLIVISILITSISLGEAIDFIPYPNNSLSSSINEVIVFHYDFFSNKQEYNVEYGNLELDIVSCLNLFFYINGSQSNSLGLKITFILNTTEIVAQIPTYLQSNFENNISQIFKYSEQFSGSMNITIICEGKANYGNSGSLTICSSTTIEPIDIPNMSDSPQPLPIIPNWIMMRKSTISTRTEEITSAFYSEQDDCYLNITLTFFSSFFSAFEQFVCISLEEEVIAERSFVSGNYNSLSFIIPSHKGLNLIDFEFIVKQPQEDITISNISSSAFHYLTDEDLSEEIFDWFQCEKERLDYLFDLTALKPENETSEQKISISLVCSYSGTRIFPYLYYEIAFDEEIIIKDHISAEELMQNQFLIKKKTYIENYGEMLSLRVAQVFGETEESCIFTIYSCSIIEIGPILEINNNETTQRQIFDDLEIQTTDNATTKYQFYEVLSNRESDAHDYNISLTLDVYTKFEVSPFQVFIKVKIGFMNPFDVLIENIGKKEFTKEISLHNDFHEITIDIEISGNGTTVVLQDLVLEIVSVIESTTSVNIRRKLGFSNNWFGKEIVLGLEISLFFLFVIRYIFRFWKKRERKEKELKALQIYSSKKFQAIEYLLTPSISLATFWGTFFSLQKRAFTNNLYVLIGVSLATAIGSALIFLAIVYKYLINRMKQKSEEESFENRWKRHTAAFVGFFRGMEIAILVILYPFVNLFITYSVSTTMDIIKKISNGSPQLFNLGSVSYYLFFTGILLSILACYFILKLAFNFAFFEDNLKKATILGAISAISLSFSWILFAVYIIINVIPTNLSVLWNLGTILLFPYCHCIFKYTKKLVNNKTRLHKVSFFRMFFLGKLMVNPKELQLAFDQNVNTRLKLDNNKKQSSRKEEHNTNIYAVYASTPQSLEELSTSTNKSVKDVEKIPVLEKNQTQETDVLELSEQEIQDRLCFISINEKTGRFTINPVYKEVFERLKYDEPITIRNIDERGRENEIDYSFIADKSSSFRILSEALFNRIEDLIEETNKIAEEYWKKQKVRYATLNSNAKRAHLATLANRIMVELSVSKVFTKEQFERDAVLFWNKDYESFEREKRPLDLLTTCLSSSLKGELAIIMIFLQSLVIMRKTSSYKLDLAKFNLVKDLAYGRLREIIEEKVSNNQTNFVLTDYFNPFIRYIFSVDESGIVDIVGWKFVPPEEMSYFESIWNDSLPFTFDDDNSIIKAIREGIEFMPKKNRPLASMDLERKSKYQLKNFVKRYYGKKNSLIALYIHVKHYSIHTAKEFKEKIRDMIQVFPTSDFDWALFAVDRQIQLINRGQDMFCETKYLLMEIIQDETGEIEAKAIPNTSPRGNKWLREGRAEIEIKSGWYQSPKALEPDYLRYTNDPTHLSYTYLSEESLHRVADAFIRKEYDVLFPVKKGYTKLSTILPKTSSHKKVISELKMKEFHIIFRTPERVNINTAISGQKHVLRRLIDITQFRLELKESMDWINALTTTTKNRNRNFVELTRALVDGEESWKGLRLQSIYGDNPIREIFANYFNSILYYNVLLFASGLPVLKFNPEFLRDGIYLPQTIIYDEEKKVVSSNGDASPTYVSINGKLDSLVEGSDHLALKIRIPKSSQSIVSEISPNSFTKPIVVESLDDDLNYKEQLVYALRVVEHGFEKVMLLTEDGFKRRKIGFFEDGMETICLARNESIYGAVEVENTSLFENSLARQKLIQLLIYGGEHYDGSKYEAMIELFNKNSLDPLTNKEKKTPFLFFQILSSTDQKGRGQYEGLTSPIRHQIKNRRKDYNYNHRPEILNVAFTSMNKLFSNVVDFSVSFGSGLEKYDQLYWNRSARKGEKDVRHHVKGKNYYINGLLNVFQIAFRNMFKIYTEGSRGGEVIRNHMWARKEKGKYRFSSSKPKCDKWHKIYCRIPFITTTKYTKFDNHFAMKKVAQRLPHILLSENTLGKRAVLKHKTSINFLLMVQLLNEDTTKQIKRSYVWKSLRKIAKKYIIEEKTQISAKDWAKIIVILFPEIATSTILVKRSTSESFKKKPLSDVNLEKINHKKPDHKELLKLFPPETRIDWFIRSPYHAFYNFFGYLLGSYWSIYYTKSNKLHEWTKNNYSQPENLIEPIYKLYVPWLINRAEHLSKQLFKGNADYFDINKKVIEGYLSEELLNVLRYSYKELVENKQHSITKNNNPVSLVEKMVWLFIRECQYIDAISFNLPESSKVMEHIIEIFEKYQDVQGVAENIHEMFKGIQEKYFSY